MKKKKLSKQSNLPVCKLIFPVFLEFKKFLQRKSNSMYNFEQPVIMKVCIKHLKSPAILYMPVPDSTSRPSSGLRAPAAAGADPAGRQLLGQNSEGIPADETHAGPQSDHGGPAEVPTMPH